VNGLRKARIEEQVFLRAILPASLCGAASCAGEKREQARALQIAPSSVKGRSFFGRKPEFSTGVAPVLLLYSRRRKSDCLHRAAALPLARQARAPAPPNVQALDNARRKSSKHWIKNSTLSRVLFPIIDLWSISQFNPFCVCVGSAGARVRP